MKDKNIEKKSITLEFRIDEIKIINFFENSYLEYKLKSPNIMKGKCDLGFKVKIDPEKNTVAIPIKATFYFLEKDERYELFGIEAVYIYKIKNFSEKFCVDKDGKHNIPDSFIKTLLGTTISGIRGMLVALHKIPEYQKIILPMFDTTRLLDVFKKRNETMD